MKDYIYDAKRTYAFEEFSFDDMDMIKEMYEEGMTDVNQLAIEQDIPVEIVIQILDTLTKSKQIKPN